MAQTWPWFDALLMGRRERIPREEYEHLSSSTSVNLDSSFPASCLWLLLLSTVTADHLLPSLPFANRQQAYYRFFRRSAVEANTPDNIRQFQQTLLDVADRIEFSFKCGLANEQTSLPENSTYHGITIYKTIFQKTQCALNFYDVEPLLNPDINSMERLLCQFTLASTVLHELAVSGSKLNQYEANCVSMLWRLN